MARLKISDNEEGQIIYLPTYSNRVKNIRNRVWNDKDMFANNSVSDESDLYLNLKYYVFIFRILNYIKSRKD